MLWIKTRKDKELFLIKIFSKLDIDQNEKEIYLLSIEILDDWDFNNFFDKIYKQVIQDWHVSHWIEDKKLAPFSANIL